MLSVKLSLLQLVRKFLTSQNRFWFLWLVLARIQVVLQSPRDYDSPDISKKSAILVEKWKMSESETTGIPGSAQRSVLLFSLVQIVFDWLRSGRVSQ